MFKLPKTTKNGNYKDYIGYCTGVSNNLNLEDGTMANKSFKRCTIVY